MQVYPFRCTGSCCEKLTRGRSVQVLDKRVFALNCHFNYMIDHVKQGSYRMLLVGILCGHVVACCHITANVC
jgi:hypothetical protein